MTVYDLERRWDACRRKNQYLTRNLAREAARTRDVPLRAYECDLCLRWHLTSDVTGKSPDAFFEPRRTRKKR